MKLTPDGQLLMALQQTVSAVLNQWLNDNKHEFVQVIHRTVLEGEVAQNERKQQPVKRGEFLTTAELAQRWRFHPESVRRMIRQGRVPSVLVGRQNRIALRAVEAFESSGAVPDRP